MSESTEQTSVQQAAHDLLDMGIVPIPVKPNSKRPAMARWQNLRPEHKDVAELFPEGSNIGVLLGKASGGLVDIDCDSPEAIAAANTLLHNAKMRGKRGDHPTSHYWFRCDEPPDKTMKFEDPNKPGDVLVELRSNGGQTVVPPSRHPDGTSYKWVSPLTDENLEPITRDEVMKAVTWIAAVALLSRYWPGRGARHHAHLALLGGLLRDPNGGGVNKEWDEGDRAQRIALIIAQLGGDDEWASRTGNYSTTIQALLDGDPVTGWTTLTKWIPERVVWTVRDWLGLTPEENTDEDDILDDVAPDEITLDTEWNREYLGDAIKNGIEPPEPLIDGIGLLFRGEIHTIQSAGGSGKSLFAVDLMWKAVRQGLKVVFIDEENGPNEIANRLLSLGVTPDDEEALELINESLIYFSLPSIDWVRDAANPRRLFSLCEKEEVDFIVFDSVMDLLSASGLDENSNTEFNLLNDAVIKPLKESGVTVLLLDHVSKDSQWMSRGASSKYDQASVVWGVKVESKFDGKTSGCAVLKRRKGRLAEVPEQVLATVNVSDKGTRIDYIVGGLFASPRTSEETEMHAEMVKGLRELGATSPDKAVSKTAVREAVNRDNNEIHQYLKNPPLPVHVDQPSGNRYAVWVEVGE